jgi:cytochrome P450
MAAEYGDVAFWRFLHLESYLFVHPVDIEAVLVTHHRSFTKGIGTRANPEVFGNGLLTSEGEFWLRQRRLSQPAFHRERIAGYAERMSHHAGNMLQGWRDGQVIDVHGEMMRVTLAIATDTLFGVDVAPHVERIRGALDCLIQQNSGLNVWQLILKVPTRKRWRYHRAVRTLDDVVYGIIRERRSGGGGEDLLSDLLRARDDDGSPMTDQQLRDETMTMLLAGHETTALALSWTWYLLGQNPEAEEKLHQELDQELAGRVPAADDVTRLPYANNVLREAMRLYPPAWVITRNATQDVSIGAYEVPRGSNVILSPWLTHHDSRFFPDAERFDPDRWLVGRSPELPKFAYFPFGGGPRLCIGAGFASMEGAVLLATIAQRFRLELAPGQDITPQPSITLRPRNGIKVKIVKR